MKTLTELPGHPAGRKFLRGLLRLLMRLLLRLEVSGVEHIPASGPLIIIINHIAFLDPVMILGIVPRVVTPMAKIEVLSLPFWGRISRIYGVIPVRRGEVDLDAMKLALRVLKNGGIVLLAPEGTRSRTYQMQPAKDGATMLALRSGAAILPIGVTGTHQVKKHWLSLKQAPVRLAVGQPFCLQPSANATRLSRTELSSLTTEAMVRLAEQLPPEFRGVYDSRLSAGQAGG